MAFSEDFYIEEKKIWGSKTQITFSPYYKGFTLKDATDPKAKLWKKDEWGQQKRVIGTISKGTLYRMDDYKEPQSLSDTNPYAIIVILNGPAKGMKGKVYPEALGSIFPQYAPRHQ
jgi:hypothetical protein